MDRTQVVALITEMLLRSPLAAAVKRLEGRQIIKGTVTFTGGTQFASVVIQHNRGLALPYGAIVCPNEQTGPGAMIGYTLGHTADQLTVAIKDDGAAPAVGTTCDFTLELTP